jgi:hypothetical protein
MDAGSWGNLNGTMGGMNTLFTRWLTLLTLVLGSTALLAQDPNAASPPEQARPCAKKNPQQPCTVPPTIISAPDPDYSREARDEGLEGPLFSELSSESTGEYTICESRNLLGLVSMKRPSRL